MFCWLRPWRSPVTMPNVPFCLIATLMMVSPGVLLCYTCLLIFRTRQHPAWRRINWLPLRGSWLCMLVLIPLVASSLVVLLGGVFVALVNAWQTLRY